MSCAGSVTTFRLLDALVGWDPGTGPDDVKGIVGLDDLNGIILAPQLSGAADQSNVVPYLPPSWFAAGCGPCAWYLATPSAQECGRPILWSQLLRLDPCGCQWQPVWPPHCNPLAEADITAIAVSGDRIAMADRTSGSIALLDGGGARVVARIPCSAVLAMAFGSAGSLLVAAGGVPRLLRFDRAGAALAPFAASLPVPAAQITGMASAANGTCWLAAPGTVSGTLRLWKAGASDSAFTVTDLAALAAALPASGLKSASADGFCLARTAEDGSAQSCCYSRFGRPRSLDAIKVPVVPIHQSSGQLLTGPIDSGLPRCVWHRLQVDADVPSETSLYLSVATAEVPGTPHPADWQLAPAGYSDVFIQQPPGRYLYLHLALGSQTGAATPRVRRVRLDFPRATSLDLLPGIYRENPEAADFTERFLALFDASIADLDAAIERAPALLDAGGVPDNVLPWLASFLGLALDPAWEPARSRAILQAVPELYRRRGTLAGLKQAFRLVFDVDPVIEEQALQRRWAGLGKNSTIGGFRLFGRNRSRAQIGRSALGATVLKSFGDPAVDPLDALAWRIAVLVPPIPGRGAPPLQRVQSLVDSQKPAHTVATLRLGGGTGFLLGGALATGVDTAFVPLPAPVLGRAGNVRLNRASVLRRGRCTQRRSAAHGMVVGQQPLME
jgi:phage tail-like protein